MGAHTRNMAASGVAALVLVLVVGCSGVLAQQTLYGRPIEELCEAQDIVECDQRTNYFEDQIFPIEFIQRASNVQFFNTFVRFRITKPNDSSFRYTAILLQCGCPVPQGISEDDQDTHIIPVPIKSAYMYETPTIYMFAISLGNLDKLKVMRSDLYLYSPDVHAAISSGDVMLTGGAHRLVVDEGVVGTVPALAVVALWEQLGHDDEEGSFAQQTSGKIQFIPNGEVYESTPLGRAEWLKIVALLTKSVPEALDIFNQVKARYFDARDAVLEKSSLRPSVITNQLFPSFEPGVSYTWSTTGKNTYTYRLLSDAGALYRLDDAQSQQLSAEEAIASFSSGRYWIGYADLDSRTTDDVLASDISSGQFVYKELDAAKCALVYSASLRVSPSGLGSDLFESAVVFPDRVLLDLTSILHPEIDTSRELFYYRKMTPSDDLTCERTVLPAVPASGRIFVEYAVSVFGIERFDLEDVAGEMQLALSDGLDVPNFLVGIDFAAPVSGGGVMQRLRLMLKPSESQPSADEVKSFLVSYLSSMNLNVRVDVEKVTEDGNTLGENPESSSGLSGGAIAGIVIGSLVAVVLVALFAVFWSRRVRSKRSSSSKEAREENSSSPEITA
ncbi:hypothetical protein FVE85_7151 [Porphyridium purpureum]|uniref:Uncharacterized protein n=1 Tax=Porphyridium purpureum TaxID=35688 RepID=A0A5J4Z755_PORPP|nr:hypothetical protein FVE85_7151 [Porphyridium purpureum]|eukprot:POR6134..scf295_1